MSSRADDSAPFGSWNEQGARQILWLQRATGLDRRALLILFVLAAGWLLMFGPTYRSLSLSIWATEEQSQGPVILAVSAWLLYRKRFEIAAGEAGPASRGVGVALFWVGWAAYAVGRSQYIWILQVGAQNLVLAALLLFFGGTKALNAARFPLFFMLFAVPLPEDLVATITAPLKLAVSAVAGDVLASFGYPIGRSGVILTIGQYQLLVADACAGLTSMFTLESMGLLYLNLMNYKSVTRNVALAVLIIPISFIANVTRVMILVLITYRFGDDVGQGFAHGFASIVLFSVALLLVLAADGVITLIDRQRRGQ